ncbi:ATP/GTP-binding protein [Streptomyces inhibens]|uniref:ATP/GTP-binding protein n=1 Tax=Streptomyces inhibens TaxID=2293571 RepID=UPI0036C5A98D
MADHRVRAPRGAAVLTRRARAGLATASFGLVLTAAPFAGADDGPVVGSSGCEGQSPVITVCAADGSSTPGADGDSKPAAAKKGGKKKPAPCTYTKLDPQPPADNLGWDGHKPSDKGAVYQVMCPDSGRMGVLWMPDAKAAPRIDPEVLARRALDRMRLDGPDIVSPRPAGRYIVGMPMWMWARKGATTFGPATASASAGSVTVTATATVSKVRWDMGDGSTVTCTGAGTPYRPEFGKQESPDCGYRYRHPSSDQPHRRYRVRATATWTVHWTGAGQAGDLTTTRTSTTTAEVGEVQVLN